MITTTPIISELQSKSLKENSEFFIEGIDLNYQGYSLEENEDFILSGTDAVKNKVIMWLLSAPVDYIREPDKGGILWSLLGKNITEANASKIKKDISTFFNANFQGELSLVNVETIKDVENKMWKIRLTVQDPIRREIFFTTVGVS